MITKDEIQSAALALSAADREALAEQLLFSISGFHNRRAEDTTSTFQPLPTDNRGNDSVVVEMHPN